jgi:environmental stress-induced protein Ves
MSETVARVIRASDCRSMPWKNGGGATTEIAVHPPGAGLADFEWRVSIATVATDGPFSTFTGVDRTLTVLEGDGLRLAIGDARPVALHKGSDPLSFAADVPTDARLLGAPVTDLNVMTRRGVWRRTVRRLALEGTAPRAAEHRTHATTVLWLCHRGQVDIGGPDGAARLGALDAWLVEQLRPTAWRIASRLATELYLVELEELSASDCGMQDMHKAVAIEK